MSGSLFLVIALLAAGYACARIGLFERSASDAFHRFIIYVCIPALIWKVLPTLQLDSGLWLFVWLPWVVLLLMAAVVRGLCALFGWSRNVCGALLLCVCIGNTSFLGFPLITALVGEDVVKYAVVYDQVGTFLGLATFGVVVVAYFGGGQPPTASQMALRVLRFPPFLACLFAFTPLVRFEILQPLWSALAAVVVPLATFAVGLRLELKPPRPWGGVMLGLGLKLIVMPLCAWLIARSVGTAPRLTEVAVLEAAMPASVTAGAMAMEAGLAPELCAALVGYGILIGLVTIPALAAVFN